ncbi:hypothetical protein GQR58_030509 [Nymphon striatum]|nr:hypothetical protein GQR58_030509 [Nymphon striatum]
MSWIEEFLGGGPDYAAEERHPHEVQTLLQQAGALGGLTKRQAQDFAGLAEHYMADPKLFAMAVAAVEGPHTPVRFEGTAEHIVIEAARIATSTSPFRCANSNGFKVKYAVETTRSSTTCPDHTLAPTGGIGRG